jgi:hypothetical protein
MAQPELKYDEEKGVYVKDSDISINWLISEILGKQNLQVSKVSNEEIHTFLSILDKTDLRMPDGKHSLFWLRDNLKEKIQMADAKTGEAWYKISERYRFIVEQIDIILCSCKNIKERMEIKRPEENRVSNLGTPNEMSASFNPL